MKNDQKRSRLQKNFVFGIIRTENIEVAASNDEIINFFNKVVQNPIRNNFIITLLYSSQIEMDPYPKILNIVLT